MPYSLKFADFLNAQRRIRPYLSPSLVEASPTLGANLYFKLENTNPTHAFKVRGALNAILAQVERAKAQGVIAASAGNHAIGLAYAAKLAGVKATIVMPTTTPQRKVKGAQGYGGVALLYGDDYDAAELYARQLEQERGELFVSAYNDPYVIAGQGTIGLEIFEQLPTIQRLIVPTSGGGLLAGVGMVAKLIHPDIEVIGVQSVATPALYNRFYQANLPQLDTVADGLAGDIEADSITVPICQTYTDKLVLVEETAIAEAIRWMFRQHGWVIEGAAAVGIAAILSGEISPMQGQDTAIIVSGANIDADKFLGLMS